MLIPWEGDCLMIKAIYKITNKINNKCYIGQSVNPHRRFTSHKSRARNMEFSESQILYNAIRKYGEENFSIEILEWTEDYNNKEIEYIKKYNSTSPNGYNISSGGDEPPHKYGEEHHNSKITNEMLDVIIKELKNNRLTEPEIGKLFNPEISQSTIHNINFGNTHHIDSETYPIRTECPYNLTNNNVEEIIWLLENTEYTMNEISEYYNVNISTIKHINSGRNYHSTEIDYPIRKHRGKKQSKPVETILVNRSTSIIDT